VAKFGSLYIAGILCLVLAGGCQHTDLNSVMQAYGYTALNPPTTGWEPGALVEIAGGPANPQPILLPSQVKPNAVQVIATSDAAPDVTQQNEQTFSLGVGASVPQWLQLQIQAKYSSVRQYSVISTNNTIKTVTLLPYVNSFNQMKVYADSLTAANPNASITIEKIAASGNGYWIVRLWYAASLEYKFYDQNGGSVNVTLDKANIASVDASGSWQTTSQGTLAYNNANSPLCVGFIARPFAIVPKAPAGTVQPQSSGAVSPLSTDGILPLSAFSKIQ
jgi:hypothetical protein